MKTEQIEAPKGGFLQIALFISGISGLGIFFYGAVDLLFSGMQSFLGVLLLLSGLIMGPGLIAVGIFLEKRRMGNFRAKVLSRHPNILIRFKDQKRKKEVVLLPEGVFVAEYFYAFDGKEMRIGKKGIELKNQQLEIDLENHRGQKSYSRLLKIYPPKDTAKLSGILQQLNLS